MFELAGPIRDRRRMLGLSQTGFAHAAGVSLATVQNAEAGRANPSLSTLTRLIRPLGLDLELRPTKADWGALVALGLPLAGESVTGVTRDADTLRRHVGRAAIELMEGTGEPGEDRRRDCLHALLRALNSHFPSVTRRWLAASPPVQAILQDELTGRVIKLARIARQTLSEYL